MEIYFIAKYSLATNNVSWCIGAGGEGSDCAYAIDYIGSGRFVVGGVYGDNSGFIMVFDTSGSIVWFRTIGFSDRDLAIFDVRVDKNGDIIGVGRELREHSNIVLVKFSPTGTFYWYKVIDYGVDSYGYSVDILSDNSIVVSGCLYSSTTSYDILVVNVENSFNGDVLWSKVLRQKLYDRAYSVVVYGDTIYIVGCSNSFDSEACDFIIVRIELSREVYSIVSIGGPFNEYIKWSPRTTIAVYDNNLYIPGCTNGYGEGLYDALLIKIPIVLLDTSYRMNWSSEDWSSVIARTRQYSVEIVDCSVENLNPYVTQPSITYNYLNPYVETLSLAYHRAIYVDQTPPIPENNSVAIPVIVALITLSMMSLVFKVRKTKDKHST